MRSLQDKVSFAHDLDFFCVTIKRFCNYHLQISIFIPQNSPIRHSINAIFSLTSKYQFEQILNKIHLLLPEFDSNDLRWMLRVSENDHGGVGGDVVWGRANLETLHWKNLKVGGDRWPYGGQ